MIHENGGAIALEAAGGDGGSIAGCLLGLLVERRPWFRARLETDLRVRGVFSKVPIRPAERPVEPWWRLRSSPPRRCFSVFFL